jgi:hypothetical protein
LCQACQAIHSRNSESYSGVRNCSVTGCRTIINKMAGEMRPRIPKTKGWLNSLSLQENNIRVLCGTSRAQHAREPTLRNRAHMRDHRSSTDPMNEAENRREGEKKSDPILRPKAKEANRPERQFTMSYSCVADHIRIGRDPANSPERMESRCRICVIFAVGYLHCTVPP